MVEGDNDEREEFPFSEMGEEDYVGANITLLQKDRKAPLRAGTILAEGVPEVMGYSEEVLRAGYPITGNLLRAHYNMLQYFRAELGAGMEAMNVTISRGHKKNVQGISPEKIQYIQAEEKEGGGGL